MIDTLATIVQYAGMNLLDTTLAKLRKTEVPFSKIAKDIDVSVYWLHRLSNGEFKDPGVNRIERLNEYLTKNRGKK